MREDPNTVAEMRHNTPRKSDAYEVDIAKTEAIAKELCSLTAKLARWSDGFIHQPPAIDDALNHMRDAQADLANALSSIERERDGG